MGCSSGTHAKDPLELVHVDLAMHWLMKTEVTCLLIAIDDASSFTYVKPLWAKLDALQVLKEWITYVMGLDAREAGGSQVHMEGTVTGQMNCPWSKGKEQCIGHRQAGPEEEEQCIGHRQASPEEEEQCRRS